MLDYITGEKFIDLADFKYSSNKKNDCNSIKNTFNKEEIKNKSIIYTHTLDVLDLFELIKNLPVRDLIIVSHNSDVNIDNTFIIPNNVKVWFTQNVNRVDRRIHSIPIGLENNRWYPKIQKKEKMLDLLLNKDKEHKGLLYINHNVKTNLVERQKIYDIFEKKCKCWCTIEKGINGQDFNNYIEKIYTHEFVICPQGNGIDTHRLWEVLYLGSIPIVKLDMNNIFYTDLPIVFVNNWEDITEQFLITEYNRIKKYTWNFDKLYFNYWKKIIKNESI